MNRFLAIILVASLLISACQSAPEKHYALKAEVISVDAPRKLITVVHGAIPGLMPAMTMTYAVSDAKEIEQLAPGDFITADLVVSDNKGRLEKIAKTTGPPPPAETPPSPAGHSSGMTSHFFSIRNSSFCCKAFSTSINFRGSFKRRWSSP